MLFRGVNQFHSLIDKCFRSFFNSRKGVLAIQDTFVPTQDTFAPTQDTFAPTEDTFVPTEDTFVPTQDTFVGRHLEVANWWTCKMVS